MQEEQLQEQKIEEDVEQKIGAVATLEAVLFMHGVPVKLSRLSEILGMSRQDILESAQILAQSYEERSAGLRILITEKEVQMVTEKNQGEIIEKFTRKELEGELSSAALEVLAIIAYRGPLSKPDIEAIRGVNCSFTLRNLLLRGLVERSPHPTDSRTKLYGTTLDLVRHLGLASREELPHYEELAGDRRIDAVIYGEGEQGKDGANDEI